MVCMNLRSTVVNTLAGILAEFLLLARFSTRRIGMSLFAKINVKQELGI